MKQLLLICAVVMLVGCGKKDDPNTGVVNPNKPSPNQSATDTPEPSTEFLETKAKAEAGDAVAQSNLGKSYEFGQGVEQDFKEAVKWYQKAADQGDANGQTSLGFMYANGEGVEQDFKEAVKWYRKAADQGDASAQYNLGLMYYNGEGVPIDRGVAYVWYSIAAANGDTETATWKDNTAKEMTPAQIAKAEELVNEMVKKNPKLLNKK